MPDKVREKSLLNNPEHWRKSAAEMRSLAARSTGDARESLLKIAAEYDRLAERAAKRVKKT